MRRTTRRGLLGASLGAVAGWRGARAALATPTGPVILTVRGVIEATNAPGEARFDLPMIEALGLRILRTRTPWTDGEPLFEGVLARDLMAAVGAHGEIARALAANDYLALIPLSDFTRWDVVLALRQDGQRLHLRDKGPIWIVYPWSGNPELDDRVTRQKSVWQLVSLTIL